LRTMMRMGMTSEEKRRSDGGMSRGLLPSPLGDALPGNEEEEIG